MPNVAPYVDIHKQYHIVSHRHAFMPAFHTTEGNVDKKGLSESKFTVDLMPRKQGCQDIQCVYDHPTLV